MQDRERLERLVKARHPCIFIPTHEESEALSLIDEMAMAMREPLQMWSVLGGLRDRTLLDTSEHAETEPPAAALYTLLKSTEPLICVMLDLAGHLRDKRTLRVLREVIEHFRRTGSTLVLIDPRDELPPVVSTYATRFELSLPDEAELEKTVRDRLRSWSLSKGIKVDIKRSAFRAILRNLQGLTRRQVEQIINDCVAEDRRFDGSDINTVLAGKREELRHGGLLEFVEAPVDLDEIGGMKRLKRWLAVREKAITGEARGLGMPAPRGVLLLGVQGAGKSFCAKAIATAWQRPLLRMDVGALYDRYVGESERRLRDAFHQAETMAPVILWVDEIEKAFASAASRSTDGGLSQRMFGSLLTWMQEHREPVFLVATANDIEALPPELLRKGRFDEIFFVDLPGEETRKQIFAIHLRKRGRDPTLFDLDALVSASEGYSGAEIEQAIISAIYETSARDQSLSTEAISTVLRESPPLSVTMAEHVDALRAWAARRCVPAD